MYCTTCGTKTLDGARFCAHCGSPISGTTLAPVPGSLAGDVGQLRPASPPPMPPAPTGYAYPPGYGPPPSSHSYANVNVRVDSALNLPLAPWWKRLVAMLIDGAILGVGYLLVLGVIGALVRSGQNASTTNRAISSGQLVAGFAVIGVLASIPSALYYGFMNGSKRGQTLGKMAMGIAVRDSRTGQRIGFWRALGRSLITTVFTLLFYVPFVLDSLAPLWDQRRQAWHDKVASSVVVDLRP